MELQNNLVIHKIRYFLIMWIVLYGVMLLSVSNIYAEFLDFDFGLPIFGIEELRLEREKSPSFNIALLTKYLSENKDNLLANLSALHKFVNLIKLSDEEKAKELKKLLQLEVISNLTKIFEEKNKENIISENYVVLIELWVKGLLLALDRDIDVDNVKDEEFENFIISIDDKLEKMPEYWLIKGLIFSLLRDRPNKYFAPMQPFEDFKNALARAPERAAHFYFVLGQAFRSLGTNERNLYLAIACYERASSIVPGNARLQNTLLSIYMALHEHFQSIQRPQPFWLEEAVYKKILTLQPNNPYALNNLGYLYAEYGVNRQLAQELCQRAVDMMPNNAAFRDSLGWAAFKNQNYEKAEKELKLAIELNPTLFEPYYHLGTLYYVTKKLDKAVQYYDKAVQLKPNSAEVLNNYAYLLAELNTNIEKAYELALKAVNLEPSNPSYLDTLGWVYYRLKKFDEAKNYLQKALKLAPNVGEIHYHIGKLYFDQMNFTEALTYLKQAYSLDPHIENLEKEIFQTVTLKSFFDALADYHKTFLEKANPEYIKRILMNIVSFYQSEGLYNEAINLIKLCNDLSNKNVNLTQPLFSYYRLDTLSTSPQKLEKTETAITQPHNRENVPNFTPISTKENQGKFEFFNKDDLKEISNLGKIIINLGPSFYKLISLFVKLENVDFLKKLSINLFILNVDMNDPYSIIVTMYNPDYTGEEIYSKLEKYLILFGFNKSDKCFPAIATNTTNSTNTNTDSITSSIKTDFDINVLNTASSTLPINNSNLISTETISSSLHNTLIKESKESKNVQFTYNNLKLIIIPVGKHLIISLGQKPSPRFINNFTNLDEKIFKYSDSSLMHIFADWEGIISCLPGIIAKLLKMFLPNYELLVSNYYTNDKYLVSERSIVYMKNINNDYIERIRKRIKNYSKKLSKNNIQNDVLIKINNDAIILEGQYQLLNFITTLQNFVNSKYFKVIVLPILNKFFEVFKSFLINYNFYYNLYYNYYICNNTQILYRINNLV